MTTFQILEIGYWLISLGVLIATVYYIATGPVNAVKVGRQLNNEQQKDNAKRNLFLTLFSLRGSPVHYDFVTGLNQIDVVFEDTPVVLDAWHNYLRDLNNKGLADAERIWEIRRIEILSRMAVSLGYGSLNQTDIMQHYYPQGHDNKQRSDYDLQESATKFFEQGKVVFDVMLDNTPGYKEQENGKKDNDTKETLD